MLFNAWALHSRGHGFVPEDIYIPACHRLTERCWLARSWHGDDMCLFWTEQAEGALINRLTEAAAGSVN